MYIYIYIYIYILPSSRVRRRRSPHPAAAESLSSLTTRGVRKIASMGCSIHMNSHTSSITDSNIALP